MDSKQLRIICYSSMGNLLCYKWLRAIIVFKINISDNGNRPRNQKYKLNSILQALLIKKGMTVLIVLKIVY